MKKDDGYELNAEYQTEIIQFRFTSVGKKGSIEKIIECTKIPTSHRRWNLGFGDVKGNDWEDNVISDNNDLRKILQTVANAVYQFFDLYSDSELLIVPIDYQRKLLYNRVFQQKWAEIEPNFLVIGFDLAHAHKQFEIYNPRKLYDYFVISLKS